MLTLERIAELRRRVGPPASIEEMAEFCDAAEAMRLMQEAAEGWASNHGVPSPYGWIYDASLDSLFCGPLTRTAYPHLTPQAAVLATLRPKGE
jgi:hypothetical protein